MTSTLEYGVLSVRQEEYDPASIRTRYTQRDTEDKFSHYFLFKLSDLEKE